MQGAARAGKRRRYAMRFVQCDLCKCEATDRMIFATKRHRDAGRSSELGPLIALRGVSRVFDAGAITALASIDLELGVGERVAIVGASGSGKSTLVNLLCGIDYPTAGSMQWEGQPVRRRDWP